MSGFLDPRALIYSPTWKTPNPSSYRVSGLKVSKVIWLWQTEKIPWILIWWWILFKEGWEFMPGWSVRSPVGLCWPQWPLILQSTFPLDCLVWNTKNCKTQTSSSPWFDDFFERFKILHYFPTKYCAILTIVWPFYGTFQTFMENLKKLKSAVNGTKMFRMPPYLVVS